MCALRRLQKELRSCNVQSLVCGGRKQRLGGGAKGREILFTSFIRRTKEEFFMGLRELRSYPFGCLDDLEKRKEIRTLNSKLPLIRSPDLSPQSLPNRTLGLIELNLTQTLFFPPAFPMFFLHPNRGKCNISP